MHTCVGSVPDSPVMAFAWRRKQTSPTSSTDFPVKRFWIQKKKKKEKEKNYNHKEKGFAVCTKGPGCVKSDSEMEPESGDNEAGRKRGRGTGAAVPRPPWVVWWGGGEQRGTLCLKDWLSPAIPSGPPSTAIPGNCPTPAPQVGEPKIPAFGSWSESQRLHGPLP